MIAFLWALTAVASPLCGLPEHLGEALPTPPALVLTLRADKLSRDAYDVPNALETDNFVVRWGQQGDVDEADVLALSETLEAVWAAEIDALGYPMPLTAVWYKLNVYVGDSGDGAPDSGGSAGYYWYDDRTYPMLVLSTLTIQDHEYAQAVAAHEFFHGVQAAFATYAFSETDFWYWEATATWVTSQVFPGNPHYASLLFGQAFAPARSINGYYYGSGGVLEFQPYGAFLFATWLTQVVDADLVRQSWDEAVWAADPIVVLDQLLQEHGWTAESAFFDFARRNAAWDYLDGEIYAASIETSGGWESPDSLRPTSDIVGGTDGWQESGPDLPHTLGANYWRLSGLPEELKLRIEPDAGPTWAAWLAGRDGAGDPIDIALVVDGTWNEVNGAHDWAEAWLVIAAVAGLTDNGEVGGVRFELVEAEPAVGPTMDTAAEAPLDEIAPASDAQPMGCGCEPTPHAPAGGVALGLVVGLLRRRQPPT